MHLLVLQHDRSEDLALFAPLFAAAGHTVTAVELDAGAPVPDTLDGVDALWIMGGPMDVFEEDKYPWLAPEKALIRAAVQISDLPVFGICLGHQLLADALGGDCAYGGAEVGVLPVTQTAPSPFLEGLGDPFEILLWHGVQVTQLPPGARAVATTGTCAIQAIQFGPKVFSLQGHPEVEPETIRAWASLPNAAEVLDSKLGPGGAARLESDLAARMPAMERNARTLFDNWCRAAGIPTGA